MCIIVYKPEGKKLPAKKILETCFINNPDGSGYMYAEGGRVHISKGYKDFNSFYNDLMKDYNRTGKKTPYVLHFRISTQAGTRPDCTHPYPLSKNMQDLRLLKCKCGIGIAHNGIIYLTASYYNVDYNDTMRFITDYLSLIIKDIDFYKDADKLKLIDQLCGSRLAILDYKGHCTLTGNGWTKDNGIIYSNTSYKPYTYKTAKKAPIITTYAQKAATPPATSTPVDQYADYINKFTGEYDFDPFTCPLEAEGDDSYCDCCMQQYKCYSYDKLDY